jgi:hypothetical protein
LISKWRTGEPDIEGVSAPESAGFNAKEASQVHRRILFSSGLAAIAITVAACLTAPADVSSTSSELACTAEERAFNGACHAACTTSTDCAAPETCMVVASNEALCLRYTKCAYLGSDTECAAIQGDGYGYSSVAAYPGSGEQEAYGASGCVGDAKWTVLVAGSDPGCGQAHPVWRCRPVAGGCALVSGATADIADN